MIVPLRISLAIVAVPLLVACSELARLVPSPVAAPDGGEPGGDRFPDVLAVELVPRGERRYDVRVTMSSPYDTAARYADGWRVLDGDGNVLGAHTLLHDHATEQPFTRTQPDLLIPDGVPAVTVQGRDQANGFGGLTVTLPVPDAQP